MNLKYDIFGIVKNAGKISVVLIALWGVVFGYIFFGLDLGIAGKAQAVIEPAAGYAAEAMPDIVAEPVEEESFQYRATRIKPYTKL